MNCAETEDLIHGYLDGELDLVRSLAIEEHLKDCPACAESFRVQQSLRKAIAGQPLYFEAPKGLEKQVRSALRQASRTEATHRRWGWDWNWAWPRALAPVAVAALVTLAALPFILRPSSEDRLTREIVSAHVRSLMATHLTDVASSDQHTVKPWFTGKLPFSPPVIDLSAQGFSLLGGRLEYVGDRPVAALVYQRRKHTINLFVWASTRTASASEKFLTRQGYNILHWSDGGMEYWAASDVNPAELRDFTQLVRGAAPPPPAP